MTKVVGYGFALLLLSVYAGFTMVCVGAVFMPAPAALWANGAPPVSAAVSCTLNLSVQYFSIFLAMYVVQAVKKTVPLDDNKKKLLKRIVFALQTSQATVSFAPMLCVLFIGARMRALQINPTTGNPQEWAQWCFYICTYSVLVQLLLVLAVPLVLSGGEVEQGTVTDDNGIKHDVEGDIVFHTPPEQKALQHSLTAFRYIIMLCMYGGFVAVIVSVWTIESPNGPTPPVSAAMRCVMNLTVQYFCVYLALQVLLTFKTTFPDMQKLRVNRAVHTVLSMKETVMYCPMLSVLFIGLRLRALQITSQKGQPQGWAQQGMYLATYGILIQLILVLAEKVLKKGEDEKEEHKAMLYTRMFLESLKYFCLVCIYGGAIACCVAVFKITPATANGQGVLIPGVNIPPPA